MYVVRRTKEMIKLARSPQPVPKKPLEEMSFFEKKDFNKEIGMISAAKWWLFSYWIMLPLTFAAGINALMHEIEHQSHEPPPYIPYDHLEYHHKDFPWGDGEKTLFHNDKWNTIPGKGYVGKTTKSE